MFSTQFYPRFSETDALGHISNTTFPVWFEQGRSPLFDIFHPTRSVENWPLILAHLEIDFLAQTFWGHEVEIRTFVGDLGRSSCPIIQEAWQQGNCVAKGKVVMVYFEYETNQAKTIPDDMRELLNIHRHPEL